MKILSIEDGGHNYVMLDYTPWKKCSFGCGSAYVEHDCDDECPENCKGWGYESPNGIDPYDECPNNPIIKD